MRLQRVLLACAICAVWAIGGAPQASAHSMLQAAVLLDVHSGRIEARLELPPSRLERAFGRPLRADLLPAEQAGLQAYVLQRLHASTEGRAWTIQIAAPLRWELVDGAPYVVADLVLIPPVAASTRRLDFTDDVITDTLPSQVVLISVRSDWNNSTFANEPDLIGILNGEERTLAIDRTQGNWTAGFLRIFHLGTRHIAEGTDHLLFLLALLLPAPLRARGRYWDGFAGLRHGFTKIFQVVTAFTAGHSLTLALAAFGWIHAPANPIEVLIAVSILVSAVHAWRPVFPGKEAAIAACFGLIHGLAFASTLAELGLHRWERVASIFAFNLGIEAMQLFVVVCIMPSLMMLSQTRLYPWFRIAGASFAGIAAAGWIMERAFHRNLHVDRAVDALAQHAILLAGLLFIAAVVSLVHSWSSRSFRAGGPAKP